MRKKARVPGLKPLRHDPQPTCRIHNIKAQRNEDGQWFCIDCLTVHWTEMIQAKTGRKTASGIELPVGVIDPAKLQINPRDILPNRAQRRARRKR